MNTFYEYEGIFGKAETAHLERALQEFFELAAVVRRKLGKQDYLLDKYISMILEGANATLLYSAVKDGFATSSELRRLCFSVMDGKPDCAEHPLYEKVNEYINAHPLDYQERNTRMSLYCIALADGFLEYAAGKYYQLAGFLQGLTNDLLYSLTSRDVETSRLAVQLWLEPTRD